MTKDFTETVATAIREAAEKSAWVGAPNDPSEVIIDGPIDFAALAKVVIQVVGERSATVALEQRCERGTPWDAACVAIAAEIRKATQ